MEEGMINHTLGQLPIGAPQLNTQPPFAGITQGATMKLNLMDKVWATTHYAELVCERIEQMHAAMFAMNLATVPPINDIKPTGSWLDESHERLTRITDRCETALRLLGHMNSDLGLPK
jgi:hypothetical protein